MRDAVAVGYGEILIAVLFLEKGLFDVVRDGVEAVGVGRLDINLLNLSRAGKFIDGVDVHNEGVVKIDIIKTDGLFDFVQDAYDHEFFTHDGNGFTNSTIDSIK